MAKADDGILGRFRGKIGTVVGVSTGSTFYMRSLPRKRGKAGPEELINRAKFKAIITYLGPLKELVKAGFKGHYTKTGGYRAALSYNRKHAIAEGEAVHRIDPALFRFSGGSLPGAVNPAVNVFAGRVEITWDPSTVAGGSASDQMMLLAYDTASERALTRIYDGPFRGSNTCSIEIPPAMQGNEAEIFIAFVAGDRSVQSDSQYLGRVAL